MPRTPSNTTRTFAGPRLDDIITDALGHLFGMSGNDEPTSFVLVFGGNGSTPEEAFREALDDINEQCIDNHGRPVALHSASAATTDTGFQVWGSVGCAPDTSNAPALPNIATITIEKESNDQWTLTITQQ